MGVSWGAAPPPFLCPPPQVIQYQTVRYDVLPLSPASRNRLSEFGGGLIIWGRGNLKCAEKEKVKQGEGSGGNVWGFGGGLGAQGGRGGWELGSWGGPMGLGGFEGALEVKIGVLGGVLGGPWGVQGGVQGVGLVVLWGSSGGFGGFWEVPRGWGVLGDPGASHVRKYGAEGVLGGSWGGNWGSGGVLGGSWTSRKGG